MTEINRISIDKLYKEDQPAYDSTIIPIEMLKLLGSCMLHAEQLLKDIIESNEHKTEENTSDT